MSKQTFDVAAAVAESQKQALAAISKMYASMIEFAELGARSIPNPSTPEWRVPTATVAVRSGYDFAAKVLEEQKAFALRLTEIASATVDESRKSVAQALAQE